MVKIYSPDLENKILNEISVIKCQQRDIMKKWSSFKEQFTKKIGPGPSRSLSFSSNHLKNSHTQTSLCMDAVEKQCMSVSELKDLATEVSKRKLEAKRQAALIRRTVSCFSAKIRKFKEDNALAVRKVEALENELEDWQLRHAAVLSDYQSLLAEKKQLLNRFEELESELSGSKATCSRTGAVCGTLLWKSTKEASLAGNILQASEVVAEFFLIASQSLYRIFETPTPDEEWMALCFVGTTANLMGSVDGRECLLSREEGQNFLETLFCCLPLRLSDKETEEEFTRLILMFFFNLSLCRNGVEYLKQYYLERMILPFVTLLEGSYDCSVKCLIVQLLLSLLVHIPSGGLNGVLKDKLSVKKLDEIGKSQFNADMKNTLQELKNLLNRG